METKELLELLAANPDLPVYCMVDGEIGKVWYELRAPAKINAAEVGEICNYVNYIYVDREDFKNNYLEWHEEALLKRFGYDPDKYYKYHNGKWRHVEDPENDAALERLEKYLEEIADKAFKQAIIVYVDDLTEEDADMLSYNGGE